MRVRTETLLAPGSPYLLVVTRVTGAPTAGPMSTAQAKIEKRASAQLDPTAATWYLDALFEIHMPHEGARGVPKRAMAQRNPGESESIRKPGSP